MHSQGAPCARTHYTIRRHKLREQDREEGGRGGGEVVGDRASLSYTFTDGASLSYGMHGDLQRVVYHQHAVLSHRRLLVNPTPLDNASTACAHVRVCLEWVTSM